MQSRIEWLLWAYSVEKLGSARAFRVGGKIDLSDRSRIDDLTQGKGWSTPENLAQRIGREFFNRISPYEPFTSGMHNAPTPPRYKGYAG